MTYLTLTDVLSSLDQGPKMFYQYEKYKKVAYEGMKKKSEGWKGLEWEELFRVRKSRVPDSTS